MVVGVERQFDESVVQEPQDDAHVVQVEGRLGHHGFAREQGEIELALEIDGPSVMDVSLASEGHEKSGIGDAFHFFEKPFLVDRSVGAPLTNPAQRMCGRPLPAARAFSN